jgi:hypothetical protein
VRRLLAAARVLVILAALRRVELRRAARCVAKATTIGAAEAIPVTRRVERFDGLITRDSLELIRASRVNGSAGSGFDRFDPNHSFFYVIKLFL